MYVKECILRMVFMLLLLSLSKWNIKIMKKNITTTWIPQDIKLLPSLLWGLRLTIHKVKWNLLPQLGKIINAWSYRVNQLNLSFIDPRAQSSQLAIAIWRAVSALVGGSSLLLTIPPKHSIGVRNVKALEKIILERFGILSQVPTVMLTEHFTNLWSGLESEPLAFKCILGMSLVPF